MNNEFKKSVVAAEKKFLEMYPGGFEGEEFLQLSKKYSGDKLKTYFDTALTKENIESFLDSGDISDFCVEISKQLNKSKMMSTFERIALQNYMTKSSFEVKFEFLDGLFNILYGDLEKSFDDFVETLLLLKDEKINAAKWPIIGTICNYGREGMYPVKPTTVKKVAKFLNYEINYQAKPNYYTYKCINEMYDSFLKESKICTTSTQVHALLYIVT